MKVEWNRVCCQISDALRRSYMRGTTGKWSVLVCDHATLPGGEREGGREGGRERDGERKREREREGGGGEGER